MQIESLNVMSPSNPSSKKSGNPVEEIVRTRLYGGHWRIQSSESTKQGVYESTETQVGGTGPTWACPMSSMYML